jgi:hypothetical protein
LRCFSNEGIISAGFGCEFFQWRKKLSDERVRDCLLCTNIES